MKRAPYVELYLKVCITRPRKKGQTDASLAAPVEEAIKMTLLDEGLGTHIEATLSGARDRRAEEVEA